MIYERLSQFITRALRRPVDQKTLLRYCSHATQLITSGQSYQNAMKEIVSAVLASPRFLYLYDTNLESERTNKVNEYELASRLSFFLWGSIPDDILIKHAREKSLSKPRVLRAQVERLLKD